MKYFLIPDKDKSTSNEYKIVKVHDEDVRSFLTRHQQEVIHEGNSIAEILMEFASDLEHTKT
ncbi:MAG: hypothetical protein BGP13_09535 [Sphingobacteriales bacterium 40-81]|nr:MAG: hypothetical protein BGP13_09535 [Sphingobacteriales bacterium 40-81]